MNTTPEADEKHTMTGNIATIFRLYLLPLSSEAGRLLGLKHRKLSSELGVSPTPKKKGTKTTVAGLDTSSEPKYWLVV